jgi:glycosyltransferase involved in cell wall biosynthesis
VSRSPSDHAIAPAEGRLGGLRSRVALVHDYLTQRGGAERVVLSLTRAFPDAPLFTSLYEPDKTFPEFAGVDVRPGLLNHVGPLRRDHRRALPFLAPAFSRLRVDADVAVVSSSGWAHGARVTGRKIVYCHTPARWLYQPDRYLRGRAAGARAAGRTLRAPLVRWDKAAAATADRYLANSSVVAERIAELYGVVAEVLPPPPAVTPEGPSAPVEGVEPGFALCVSRLLPYKNVDAVVQAFAQLDGERLVVAGAGPDEAALRAAAPPNVTVVGRVTDEQLRSLYRESDLLVAASHEDFGLTPLEAASFGKPSVVLRWGGFLDTVREGETGVFFETPTAEAIADALSVARSRAWDAAAIRAHSDTFAEARFIDRIRAIVDESA